MLKENLIESVEQIPIPSEKVATILDGKVEVCAAELSAALRSKLNLEAFIGHGNLDLMENNHVNHFRYMATMAHFFDATSFVETVIWVFRIYRAKGFDVSYWEAMLPEAKLILKKNLQPEAYDEAAVMYDWLIEQIPLFKALTEEEASFYEDLGFAAAGAGHDAKTD